MVIHPPPAWQVNSVALSLESEMSNREKYQEEQMHIPSYMSSSKSTMRARINSTELPLAGGMCKSSEGSDFLTLAVLCYL